jgi:hypothetical protein
MIDPEVMDALTKLRDAGFIDWDGGEDVSGIFGPTETSAAGLRILIAACGPSAVYRTLVPLVGTMEDVFKMAVSTGLVNLVPDDGGGMDSQDEVDRDEPTDG